MQPRGALSPSSPVARVAAGRNLLLPRFPRPSPHVLQNEKRHGQGCRGIQRCLHSGGQGRGAGASVEREPVSGHSMTTTQRGQQAAKDSARRQPMPPCTLQPPARTDLQLRVLPRVGQRCAVAPRVPRRRAAAAHQPPNHHLRHGVIAQRHPEPCLRGERCSRRDGCEVRQKTQARCTRDWREGWDEAGVVHAGTGRAWQNGQGSSAQHPPGRCPLRGRPQLTPVPRVGLSPGMPRRPAKQRLPEWLRGEGEEARHGGEPGSEGPALHAGLPSQRHTSQRHTGAGGGQRPGGRTAPGGLTRNPRLFACAEGMPGSALRSEGRASLMSRLSTCGSAGAG